MLIYAADLILPLKILLVVFVVTIIGATIGLKFVRSENKIVCMWLVPIGCLGGPLGIRKLSYVKLFKLNG